MKLFTIGDSISQGFMSMAAARTELSYSTLMARVLGLTPEVTLNRAPSLLYASGGTPPHGRVATVQASTERAPVAFRPHHIQH